MCKSGTNWRYLFQDPRSQAASLYFGHETRLCKKWNIVLQHTKIPESLLPENEISFWALAAKILIHMPEKRNLKFLFLLLLFCIMPSFFFSFRILMKNEVEVIQPGAFEGLDTLLWL